MNVAALIFALAGAGLSLFQGFISIPFLGEISLNNIWGLILSNLSETGNLISEIWGGLSDFGEKAVFVIVFILVLGFLLLPVAGVWDGFRAFLRKGTKDDKDNQPYVRLRGSAILCVIASGVLYFAADSIMKEIAKEMGESEIIFRQLFSAQSVFLSHVPLIWAACFAVASACAYADMKEQNKLKENSEQQTEQLNKMQDQLTKIQENMNKIAG